LSSIDSDKAVFYTNVIDNLDLWNSRIYQKYLQQGDDLGARMNNAFQHAFNEKYAKVIIVGSDLPDLKKHHIDEAFEQLDNHDLVIGPAQDGGYYLLAMKKMNKSVFINKDWGTDSVFRDTMNDLKNENVFLLDVLNDVDTYQDIKDNIKLKELI
jgi:rSAM/selenodomain-associated transferase 1